MCLFSVVSPLFFFFYANRNKAKTIVLKHK